MVSTTITQTGYPLAGDEMMVGMGQALARRAPQQLWAILGSCVAVVLCDPKRQVGALCHVVLPSAAGRSGSPAKFADTAVPHMLQLLCDMGIPGGGLVAKIAGGASMFGRAMPMEVGENNTQSIVTALAAAGIRVTGRDVGGNKGRRVTLDCSSGKLLIEVLGSPDKIL
jgi:chemotaxis protein CheD